MQCKLSNVTRTVFCSHVRRSSRSTMYVKYHCPSLAAVLMLFMRYRNLICFTSPCYCSTWTWTLCAPPGRPTHRPSTPVCSCGRGGTDPQWWPGSWWTSLFSDGIGRSRWRWSGLKWPDGPRCWAAWVGENSCEKELSVRSSRTMANE